MNTLTVGKTFTFTPTGKQFQIAKVTDTRISWYLGFSTKSSWGRNTMKMAWCQLSKFEAGVADGTYILND